MQTTIAVLTDVHGNFPALKAVLDEIDKMSTAEHIYCLGDMIAIGPDTNKVLETLFARDDVSMVTGNHEDEVLKILNGETRTASGGEGKHHKWIADRLDPKYIPMLNGLPREIRTNINGHNLLFHHYHQNKEGQFSPIEKTPREEKLDYLYMDEQVDFVAFGHHHPVHFFETSSAIYLNPGSLGCFDKPYARYSIVKIDSEAINVSMKEVPYNNQNFLESYNKLQIPESEFILNIFHGNQHL
ncbi:metallophosphoesterase family protein [Pseudalkalibacillus caeni]|uniref:metallophosphoesterase family protein n=1 Tax=Exobacillus caeni TaxID=2574798 RepID=UPI001FE55D8A|nr:metallophosphoesterase family protein [Pseudalkalibacillus caeni]